MKGPRRWLFITMTMPKGLPLRFTHLLRTPSLFSFHVFHVPRARVRTCNTMYQHRLVLPPTIQSLSIFHPSYSPFTMHLLTPLRGLCIHACTALFRLDSTHLVHHRPLTVHLFTFFTHKFLLTTLKNLLPHTLSYLSLAQLYNTA